MNTSDLQFNIIYTPNTVEFLSPFLLSLLQWTDCRFRIVANGCLPEERAKLEAICRGNDRLEYLLASADKMLEHGVVLDWLQEQTNSDWFCFMDSDIIAIDSCMKQLASHLDQCDVFSSGHPLWHAPEDVVLPAHFRRLQGSYFGTEDGKTLGGTYFAIYNNLRLTATRKSTGVGFRFYRWDEVSPEHKEVLRRIGLDKLDYDTGKLLMGLMFAEGVRFRSEDLQVIAHLGGFSAGADDKPAFHYRGRFDQLACRLVGGHLAAPLLRLADTWYGLRRRSPGLSAAQNKLLSLQERRVMQSRERKRRNTARYFNSLMRNLRSGHMAPKVPVLGYGPAEQRIEQTATRIRQLYEDQGLIKTSANSSG